MLDNVLKRLISQVSEGAPLDTPGHQFEPNGMQNSILFRKKCGLRSLLSLSAIRVAQFLSEFDLVSVCMLFFISDLVSVLYKNRAELNRLHS